MAMHHSMHSRRLLPSEPLPASSFDPHPDLHRVKLMCSYGGRILPRPHDNLLRYVGGESRIVAFSRFVSFPDFVSKLSRLFGAAVSVKYQLPSEDLDSLISITCDEDLENMMEEYEKIQAPRVSRSVNVVSAAAQTSSRLRLFLYPVKKIDRNSEVRHNDALDRTSVLADSDPFAISEAPDGFPRGTQQLDPLEEWASATSYGSMKPQIYLPQASGSHVEGTKENNQPNLVDSIFGTITGHSHLPEQHSAVPYDHLRRCDSSPQQVNLVETGQAYNLRFDVTKNPETSEASLPLSGETADLSNGENLIQRSLSELVVNFGHNEGKPSYKEKQTFETGSPKEASSELSQVCQPSRAGIRPSMEKMTELKDPSFTGDPIFDEDDLLLSNEVDGKTSTPLINVPSLHVSAQHQILDPARTSNQSVSAASAVLASSDRPKQEGTYGSKINLGDAQAARVGEITPLEVFSQAQKLKHEKLAANVVDLQETSQLRSATNAAIYTMLLSADSVSNTRTTEVPMQDSKQDADIVSLNQKLPQIIPSVNYVRKTMPTTRDPAHASSHGHIWTARHEIPHGANAKIIDPVIQVYATGHPVMHVREPAMIHGRAVSADSRNVRDPQVEHHNYPGRGGTSALTTRYLDGAAQQSTSEFIPVLFPEKKPPSIVAGQRSVSVRTTRPPFSPHNYMVEPVATAPYPKASINLDASPTIVNGHGDLLPVRGNPFVDDFSSDHDQVMEVPLRNQQSSQYTKP